MFSIASVYGGKRIPAGTKLTTVDTGHKYIRVSDMKNSSVKMDDIHFITDDIYQQIKSYTISKEDLYITVAGTIGSVGEIPEALDMANLTENADKIVFSIINKRYFMYLLQSELVQSQIKAYTTKVGQPKLAIIRIQKFLLAIPPLSEQQRIVTKIENVFPIIDKYCNSQQQLNKLNDTITFLLRKSILQEAIQGKLIPQDTNDEPASVLLERIKEEQLRLVKDGKLKKKDIVDSVIYKGDDNKYYEKIAGKVLDISEEIPFDLPETWAWCRFATIVNYRIGKTPTRGESHYWSSGTIPWVSISDMKDYGLLSETKEAVTEKASSLFGPISPQGTLLMSFKLTVGRTSILGIDAYHNEAIISIWPIVDVLALRNYLFYTLPLLANLGESKDAIKGKTLNSDSINKLLIPLPPTKEQIRIEQKIKELYKQL